MNTIKPMKEQKGIYRVPIDPEKSFEKYLSELNSKNIYLRELPTIIKAGDHNEN